MELFMASSFMSIVLSCIISVGRCNNLFYSMCWMFRETTDSSFQRSDGKLLLNDVDLQSISAEGVFSSVTVSTHYNNSISLQYPQVSAGWTVFIQGIRSVQISGKTRPLTSPDEIYQDIMEQTKQQVFPCETGTIYLHQDVNLIIVIGYTHRHPVSLESTVPSGLKVSWDANPLGDPHGTSTHAVSLYQPQGSSYSSLTDPSSSDRSENYLHFTGLRPCQTYLVCVERTGTHLFTCVSSVTVPELPENFQVVSWNQSSLTVSWDFPQNSSVSHFLLTAFYLDSENRLVSEEAFLQPGTTAEDPLLHPGTTAEDLTGGTTSGGQVFTLSDLQPCSRVKLGLQSVCSAGTESRYTPMVLVEGTAGHFTMEELHMPSYGPDNYTLSWRVKSRSQSLSYRVYHQDSAPVSTQNTHIMVDHLQPCQQYLTRVELLCGDLLMSQETFATHTGPYPVSNLTYSPHDSTVWWNSSSSSSDLSFLYELSFDNDTAISSGVLSNPRLALPGLAHGEAYKLNVWAECSGGGAGHVSDPALLCFTAVGVASDGGTLEYEDLDYMDRMEAVRAPGSVFQMVVPWSLPEPLRDPQSEPRAAMMTMLKHRLDGLLGVSVNILDLMPYDEGRTTIIFTSDREDLVDHLRSLRQANITMEEEVLHWNGEDECVLSHCPVNSVCVNTLSSSHTCVCLHGFYDVGPLLVPPVTPPGGPVCNERGLFSQHLANRLLSSGVARRYLEDQLGGPVRVMLNDGRCSVNQTDTFFHFRIPRKSCGTKRLVNNTHTEYWVTLSAYLSKAQTIIRREHKVLWKFVYPRKSKARISMQPQWLNIYSLVVFNSSQVLRLSLNLYEDKDYEYKYSSPPEIPGVTTLFFLLSLEDHNDTFASDVTVEVVSCWTTDRPDPDADGAGELLRDGCRIDPTFNWLPGPNQTSVDQKTKFSMERFWMDESKKKSIYFHCMARICGHDEDCTTDCSDRENRFRRSANQRDGSSERQTIVSVGPLTIVSKSHLQQSIWAEHAETIAAVAGPISFMLIVVLGVSAAKAIMTYYENLRLQ